MAGGIAKMDPAMGRQVRMMISGEPEMESGAEIKVGFFVCSR